MRGRVRIGIHAAVCNRVRIRIGDPVDGRFVRRWDIVNCVVPNGTWRRGLCYGPTVETVGYSVSSRNGTENTPVADATAGREVASVRVVGSCCRFVLSVRVVGSGCLPGVNTVG